MRCININIHIVDSAISLVPVEWQSNHKIRSYINKYQRLPLIDGSIHQHLLKDIPLEERKDRPDILHFGLLTALGYVDIVKDLTVSFSTETDQFNLSTDIRLPRSQKRFYGILEQLLSDKYRGKYIKKVDDVNLSAKNSIIFSSNGRQLQKDDFLSKNYIFGGFAHGGYKSEIFSKRETVSLSPAPMELWTAISFFINRYIEFHEYKNQIFH